MEEAYQTYFQAQAGAGSTADPRVGSLYKASFAQQSGRGCCGIGRVLTEAATPLVVRGVKAISQEMADASLGLYRDVQEDPTLQGIRRAATSRAGQVRRNLIRRARTTLVGRGARRKAGPTRRAAPKRRKRAPTRRKAPPRRRTTPRRTIKRGAARRPRQTGAGLHCKQTLTAADIFT